MSEPIASPVAQSPLHAFGLAAQARSMDASAGVWANELPLEGYISVRGDPGDAAFVAAVSRVLRVGLPTQPCTFAATGATTVLWLAPDEWMIVTPRSQLGGLKGDLGAALAGIRSQVVDNSGGYTQVLVRGLNAADVLAHATVYDLATLMEGGVVGTTFGKSSVYLRRERDGFCLLLRRSFADYIWRYLVHAAAPYGFGVCRLDGGDA